jgi:hypothetical protein
MSLGDVTALQEISDTEGAAHDTSATVSTHDKKVRPSVTVHHSRKHEFQICEVEITITPRQWIHALVLIMTICA